MHLFCSGSGSGSGSVLHTTPWWAITVQWSRTFVAATIKFWSELCWPNYIRPCINFLCYLFGEIYLYFSWIVHTQKFLPIPDLTLQNRGLEMTGKKSKNRPINRDRRSDLAALVLAWYNGRAAAWRWSDPSSNPSGALLENVCLCLLWTNHFRINEI